MTSRETVESLLRDAYAARVRGDIDGVCRCFSTDPTFAMAGSNEASPLPMRVSDAASFRSALANMIKSFELHEPDILDMIIDGPKAAVYWRARVRSPSSGAEVVTEFVDLLVVEDGKIVSLVEFCDTALANRMMDGMGGAERPHA